MKPAPFAYHRANSVAHAVQLLEKFGSTAAVLSGGQSLMPSMNLRLRSPAHIVDIGRVAELDTLHRDGNELVVGAMVRQARVEFSKEAAELVPLLPEGVRSVAHPPIRHRGTVVGSIAHGAAVAELPTIALALDATIVLQARSGHRTVPARQFFRGAFSTARAENELVAAVRFPIKKPGQGTAWCEFSPRSGNFPFAGAGVALTLERGRITHAAIALCGVSDRPVRADAAEQLLLGSRITPELFARAANSVAIGLEPRPDGDIGAHIVPVRANSVASWSYRIKIAQIQARKALTTAAARAAARIGEETL